jgi:Na+/H+-dicarboxylate symporter
VGELVYVSPSWGMMFGLKIVQRMSMRIRRRVMRMAPHGIFVLFTRFGVSSGLTRSS